ncbi:helix-turn-helix transcriptional regulator [Gallibacterium melopsittaci]|uniref:Helix-turn-helix transcriptional regulator n=1 Tax=Gallibacterium melopsittaci TaxID=516063 RepID=A0ABV6HYP2_9PAST
MGDYPTKQNTELPPYLTAKDIVKLTGLTLQTIRKHYNAGHFPKPVKVGKKEFWNKAKINAFLSNEN